jgi:hypothetical protein
MIRVSTCFHFLMVRGEEERVRLGAPDDRGSAFSTSVPQTVFHAAWSKNVFLSKALEQLCQNPALLCDADVHLPAKLIQRMETILAKCPERGILYGLAGRRLCSQVPEVVMPAPGAAPIGDWVCAIHQRE